MPKGPRLEFEFPGEPVAKQRPRVTRGGASGPRTYTPNKTLIAERQVAWTFRHFYPSVLVDDDHDFKVTLEFYIGSKRRIDIDNLVKTILDGLNGVVWKDDSQVTDLRAQKVLKFPEPHTWIRLEHALPQRRTS